MNSPLRARHLFFLVSAWGCGQEPVASGPELRAPQTPAVVVAEDDPKPVIQPPDPYAEGSFPATAVAWSLADFTAAAQAIVKNDVRDPAHLLRDDGPQRLVFVRLTSVAAIDAAMEGSPDPEALLELGSSMAAAFKLYADAVARGKDFGSEYVAIAAVYLHVAGAQFRVVVDALGFTAAKLKTEPVRLDGLLKMRYGLRLILAGLLQSCVELPGIVDAQAMASHVGPILAPVAALLLPEEAAALTNSLAGVARAGATAESVDVLRQALVPGMQRHPLVTDLLPEHRAYAERTDAGLADTLGGAATPVNLGSEAGGDRYGFPGQTFSAVFDDPPTALTQRSTADDGAAVTIRTLGRRDAAGFSRSVVCTTRLAPQAKGDRFAKRIMDSMGASSSTALEVSGHPGLIASLSRPDTAATVAAFELKGGGCLVIAEYPAALEGELADRARAFVASVRL